MVSRQARNLTALVLGGIVIGYLLSFFSIGRFPMLYVFLQWNYYASHGWFWQLITSMIVAPPSAQGLEDVGLNALSLLLLDNFTTAFYGSGEYYGLFFGSGVAGNILGLLNGPAQISFGASGGIFGLVAGLVSFDYAANRRLSGSLVVWFVFIFIYSSFLLPNVDWLAHLGGAVLGLVVGFWLGRKRGAQEL